MKEITKARKLFRDVANVHATVETNDGRPSLVDESVSADFREDDFVPDVPGLTSDDFAEFVLAFASLLDDLSVVQVIDHSLGGDLGCLAHCLRRAVLGDCQAAREVK